MLKHLYGDLGYSATMFGTSVGVFGAATALVSKIAGGLSDRHGRLPMIAIGMLLNVCWYLGVVYLTDYPFMLAASILSGVGAGLVTPALSAAYVDMTDPNHRGRVAALKEMIISVGGMCGPLFSVYMTERIVPPVLLGGTATLIAVTALAVAVLAFIRRNAPPVRS
jgi:MFS family permease